MFSTKIIYHLACTLLTGLCLALYYLLFRYEVLPRSMMSQYGSLIVVACPIIERIVIKLCRMLGVSQESVTVERFERVDNTSPNFVAETLEYPGADSAKIKLAFLSGGFLCLVFGIGTVFWLLNPADDENMVGKVAAPLGLLFFGVLTGLLAVVSRSSSTIADAQGVHVHTVPWLQKKVVPWPEIQQMEIETKHNVLGDLASITISLQSANGQEQKMGFLQMLPESIRNELVYRVIANANLQQVASLSNE